jgi:aminopeptidase N
VVFLFKKKTDDLNIPCNNRRGGQMKKSICLFLILLLLGSFLGGCSNNSAAAAAPFSNWSDRQPFSSGLVKDEQKNLQALEGASVYHIDVTLSDSLTELSGSEEVRYTNQEPNALHEVYFKLFPNAAGGSTTVSDVTQDGKTAQTTLLAGDTSLRVALTGPLKPGESTNLRMNFKVQIPTKFGGTYGIFGYVGDVLMLDGFYPTIPVFDTNGWHAQAPADNADTTFQDASFYEVRVNAPADLVLAASGVQVKREVQSDRQVVTFAAGPARDFYIAASSRFKVWSETIGETTVNSIAFAGDEAGAKLALTTAVNAINDYSTRYGTYPYTEFDVVSGSLQNAYGIEYPGITVINHELYDPRTTIAGISSTAILESTVAHETGHQWFYNGVGNDQTNEPWLDESVTQYITGRYFFDQYGEAGYQDYRGSWISRWERVYDAEIPIGMPAGSYEGLQYSAIVYGRGPLFLETLAKQMGQSTFDQFLRDYYQSNEWGIGSPEIFKQSAEDHCQCDLTPLFEKWVEQE